MMHDVIVVGAGPAGSVAAMELAKRGYKVLLLEKFKFPRFKVCAGGIGYRIWKRFKEIAEDGVPVKRALFVGPSGFNFSADAGEVLVYDVSRDVFDTRLAKLAVNAGAELLEEADVINVKIEDKVAKVFTRKGEVYEGRAVIGADGVNSVVSRSLKLMPPNWFKDNAFCPITLIPWKPAEGEEPMHEFYFGILGEGYGWVFPHVDHLNIGIGTLRKNYKNPRQDLIDFITKHPVASKRIKGKPEKIMGFYIPYNGMLRKLYTNRALLIGDAGGFVNTLTGEGLTMAITTAELAVKVLSEALDEDNLTEEKLSEYQKLAEEHEHVGQELRIGRLLRTMMFKDLNLLDELIRLAAEDKKMLNMLFDMIYVRKPYPKLVKEMTSITPLKVNMKLLFKCPREVLSLKFGGSDPYFPRGGE